MASPTAMPSAEPSDQPTRSRERLAERCFQIMPVRNRSTRAPMASEGAGRTMAEMKPVREPSSQRARITAKSAGAIQGERARGAKPPPR